MNECKSQHDEAYGGHCKDASEHTGDHWAFSRHGVGYKFHWPQTTAETGSNQVIPAEAVEAAARGMAIHDNDDGCFLEVDAWNEHEEWEREAYPENYPGSAIEDCAYWTAKARAALEAAAPHMMAGAKADALEDAAGLADKGEGGGHDSGECDDWAAWLRDRAASYRSQP